MRILSIVASLIFAIPAWASDGPSYEETVEFIRKKTSMKRDGWDTQRYRNWIEERGHCKFVDVAHLIATKRTDYWKTGPVSNERIYFDLSNFDPSRVELVGSGTFKGDVIIHTYENRDLVDYEYEYLPTYFGSFKPCMRGEYDNKAKGQIYVKEKDSCRLREANVSSQVRLSTYDVETNGPKLKKAITHLIKLCGGKEELF